MRWNKKKGTKIEWTDETWNPIVGCSVVSPGCTNCYAMRDARRLVEHPGLPHYHGTIKRVNGKPVWTGKVGLASEKTVTKPTRWRLPRRIFVNSMGDLFHEAIPRKWLNDVFAIMAACPQHIFQVLTKRPEVMLEYIESDPLGYGQFVAPPVWPLPNVWLGVSVEDQERADERIPTLLATPAATRFISAEPLLGPVDLSPWLQAGQVAKVCVDQDTYGFGPRPHPGLDWVIVGGESGQDARPMGAGWVREIRDDCHAAGVAFFFKQWGEYHPIYGRVGKKAAGRELDRKVHDETP